MNKENIAFLFAGQGAQYVGMGKELYDNIPECREVFDRGEEILNMPIKNYVFNGPMESLTETEIAQPAIHLTSLACLKALELNGVEAEYTVGLSLGEYGSLVYGGALSFEESLLLIKERGKIMGSSLPSGLGKMAAIMRLDDEKMNTLLKKASEFGVCEGANYNCPGQVSISGTDEAIDKAIEITKELGGRAILLNVSGPFHSSLLKNASENFYEALKDSNICELNKTVYANVSGMPYKNGDDIKIILKNHIMSSVYFEKAIRDMIDKGVTTFIEIGPGKALRGFVKKINKEATLLNVEDITSLQNVIEKIK